jgi:hypothetical protein
MGEYQKEQDLNQSLFRFTTKKGVRVGRRMKDLPASQSVRRGRDSTTLQRAVRNGCGNPRGRIYYPLHAVFLPLDKRCTNRVHHQYAKPRCNKNRMDLRRLRV